MTVAGVLTLLALPTGVEAQSGSPDSTGRYLERIQRRDTGAYSPELLQADPSARDSAMAILDSLGFEGYRELTRTKLPPWDFSLLPAMELTTYNRVEGLVFGLGVQVASNRHDGLDLALEGAWATASGEFRHVSEVNIPAGPIGLTGGYADRVASFGSSRVSLSGVRALVGGSDDQDYLHRRGGWGGIRIGSESTWFARAVYASGEERSVRTRGVWSLFGDLDEPNPGIVEGSMRSIDVDLGAGSMSEGRERLELAYRIAGGGLEGDFAFHRVILGGEIRRYLLWGTEAQLTVVGKTTGGDVPVQELADLGGLSTVRGFPRRARVGEASASGRVETYLPLDPLAMTHIPILERSRLQIVLWGDAGRVWEGASSVWLTSVGIGLQRYLGPFGSAANLRLDFAFPTGPERPDDLAVMLRFTPALF